MHWFRRRRHRDVMLLWSDPHRHVSSTVGLVDDLAEVLRRTSTKRRFESRSTTGLEAKDSILLFSKNAALHTPAEQLLDLREKGNVLCFSIGDEAPPPTSHLADAFVVPAYTLEDDLRSRYPGKVVTTAFAVNPIVEGMHLAPLDRFAIGYFGELFNAVITEGIEQLVDFHRIDTSIDDTSVYAFLPDYSLHYAVRQPVPINYIKPFTKGITAAHAGANVVVQASDVEAVRWLGADYPYLLHGEATEAAILEHLQYIRESWGSGPWHDALSRMADVRSRSTNRRLLVTVNELFDALD